MATVRFESRAEAIIREFIKRGTVHCNIRVRHLGTADDFRLNKNVLNQYLDQLQEVAAERGLEEKLRLEPLASLPGVVEGILHRRRRYQRSLAAGRTHAQGRA